MRHLLVRIVDDASYYMTTARNLAAGRGLTFDGIHPTNGFHPLWLLMLVPLFLLHGTPETMIRLVVLLQTILLSLAYLVFWRTQSKIFSPRTAALTGILFVYFVFLPCINGMESALLVLSIAVLYGYGLHVAQTQLNRRRAALLGIILGCVLLARLDMIFIALYVFAWLARRCFPIETRSRAVAAFLVCALAAAAVVGPYLVFNFLQFGSVMPISGALKSSFPHIALGANTLPRIAAVGSANLVSAALAIGWSLWTVIRTLRNQPAPDSGFYTTATTMFAWAITTHFLYTLIFMKDDTFSWYFVIYPLFAIVFVTGSIDRVLKSNPMRTRPAVYSATAALLIVAVIGRDQTRDPFPQNGRWHSPVYNAALWAREHTPPEAIFAMSDCGHFGFFSLRRVINLDGLVNDMDFQRTLAEHRLNQYLRQNDVDFLIQHAVHGREDVIAGGYNSLTLPFPSRAFEGLGDRLQVREQSEVYRSTRFFDGPYPSVLVIWLLRGN
ncbi:MAG TPA: hypothetical protein VNZ53_34445 [Steroidobacteraceae bacterium]|nr:hypothetical protein [Steroidobacteraceae bacterium]